MSSNYIIAYNQSLRNLYAENRAYGTKTGRESVSALTLAKADSSAIGRGILTLGKFNYGSDGDVATDSEKKSFSEKLRAFVDSYNMGLDSNLGTKDRSVIKVTKEMKKLVENYKDDLASYGISVKSGGYLSLSSSAVDNLSMKTFEKKFGKDSDFMKDLSKLEKKLSRHFDAYA